MSDNAMTGSTPADGFPALPRQEALPPQEVQEEQDTSQFAEDPGYLTRTGEVVGEDGSVVPIIGGLPAVEGSAWDTGAPLDDRGADLAGGPGSV